VSEKIRGA